MQLNYLKKRKIASVFSLILQKHLTNGQPSNLTQKLNYYGIRGHSLRWFESYLHERKQCVSIGNTNSDVEILKCGVPQGSILGPLLFLLYINDITNSSNKLKFLLFADDTCLSYSFESSREAESIINDEWLVTNRLSLNVDKSTYLILSLKTKEIN